MHLTGRNLVDHVEHKSVPLKHPLYISSPPLPLSLWPEKAIEFGDLVTRVAVSTEHQSSLLYNNAAKISGRQARLARTYTVG